MSQKALAVHKIYLNQIFLKKTWSARYTLTDSKQSSRSTQ